MRLLHPPEFLRKLSPAIEKIRLTVILIGMGLVTFIAMWLSVLTKGFLQQLDEPLFRNLSQLNKDAPNWFNNAAQLFTDIGSQGITVATVLLLLYFLVRRHFHRFWLLFTAVAGGELVWLSLIFLAKRPRPVEITAVTGLKLPGFPSGHVMIFVAFFGALLYMDLLAKKNRVRFTVLLSIFLVLSLISGVLRLYFGAHYLTDVIAGYGIGVAWTVLALVGVDWIWFSRQEGKD